MANDSVLAVLQAAVASLQAGEPAALLTIVRAAGSTPRRAGAKMLLRSDGGIVGTIGGGTMEDAALADARRALAAGRPMVGRYDITGAGPASLGMCGGEIEVSIEVLQPAPRLLIIGAGHIAQPLAAMAALIGFDVTVLDDRPGWVTPERFPAAVALHIVAYDRDHELLAPLPVPITPSTAVVVATWGWDEPALRQVLLSPAFYIGLVGSRRKVARLTATFTAAGFTPEHTRLHAPVGLDLGGDTPGEIALSILAEIQLARTGKSGRPLSATPPHPQASDQTKTEG